MKHAGENAPPRHADVRLHHARRSTGYANIDWQRRAALAKHFANKHQHGERRGDQRRAVKRETVAPGDMHRQHRRAVAACELHKTGVPDAVLDTARARARPSS